MTHSHRLMESPVGELTLLADSTHLLAVLWENDSSDRVAIDRGKVSSSHLILRLAEKQLEEYFSGKRRSFDIPIRFVGGTPFQNEVWKALREIPYGQTLSYAALAKRIGRPRAHRAVGSANGKNPLSIVVPCHRVIASSGKLAGFAGGLQVKKRLLSLEKTLDSQRPVF